MKKACLTLMAAVLALSAPATVLKAGEREDRLVNQATAIINRFKALPEKEIPHHVMRDAKGLAILTVAKAGFLLSGKGGEGVVVARTKNGWSGPSFIRTGGIGFGPQVGAQITELVLVLNTPEAVQAFAKGNARLGGELSVAAGPMGRSAEAGVTPKAAIYAYSRSQGLFAGASLEGALIQANKKANERYYHRTVGASAILAGRVQPPASADHLLASL